MEIGLAELRSMHDVYEHQQQLANSNNSNTNGTGNAFGYSGTNRRGSSAALAMGRGPIRRRSSAACLGGGGDDNNQRLTTSLSLVGLPAELRQSLALEDKKRSGGGLLWDESIYERDLEKEEEHDQLEQEKKASLFLRLGVAHSDGSKKAQQRVTDSILQERRRKKQEAAAIDRAIEERRMDELALRDQVAQKTREQRRQYREEQLGGSGGGGGAARRGRHGVILPPGGNWSLNDQVPVLNLPPSQ